MFPGKIHAMNVPFSDQGSRTEVACGRGQGLIRPKIRRLGRVLAGSLLLYLLGAAHKQLPTLSAEDQKELTKEQQQALRRKGLELNKEGFQLYQQGRYLAATKRWEQALAICQRLYSKAQYPQGHPDLATSLNNLGIMLQHQGKYAQAYTYYQKALAMYERLYPKEQYPKGHPHLALGLNNVGFLLEAKGEYTLALRYFKRALAMRKRLFSKEEYPQGHSDLAQSLSNIGAVLGSQGEYAEALTFEMQALAMNERLYPKEQYPRGHFQLAQSLNNLAFLFKKRGEYTSAREYFQQALAMRERLYPKEQYPQGHDHLAQSLNNMGFLLEAQGEYALALRYFTRALAMRKRLYPKEQYPEGHPHLVTSLNNVGAVLQAQREHAMARRYYEQALKIDERLYPKDKYPQGHPQLASGLESLGVLLWAEGQYAQASKYLKQALEMTERLYPKEKFLQGHPDLARGLNILGSLLHDQGEYAQALIYFKQALAMRERLYPKQKYPQGHPHLASSLISLGAVLKAQGQYVQALRYLKGALEMRQDLCELFATGASEAESFSLAARLPWTLDGLLSVSLSLNGKNETNYTAVWRSKAAITRILEGRRQELLRLLSSHDLSASRRQEMRATWAKLQGTRRELSRLLLTPAADSKAHYQRLQKLSQDKVDLEQQLAKLLPVFGRRQALLRQGHQALVKKLPPGTVFIDLLRYVRFEQNPKRPGKHCYVAFVLCHGQPVTRVDLLQAAAIDQAVAAWRSAIKDQQASAATQKLRRLLWVPLAKHVPKDCKTLLLAPDSSLTQLPWAALPISKEGRVLLEDYALAVVPHGPYLLQQLTSPADQEKEKGRLLAVGAVQYDAKPQAAEKKNLVAWNRAAEWGDRKVLWNDLPGTRKELDKVIDCAGMRSVRRLTGVQASTSRLLAELPDAHFVHLATHGFFADKKLRSVLQIDEKLFDPRSFREGPPPGARNPLVLSGLVLAGANLPQPKDLKSRTESDGGILTAEAIAGLPLHKLELAVLSACETGLGEVAGGEGVFGLQRAFHLAGARNVVASLWKVDDKATAALMALFYDKLWRQKKPAIEALREAQLTLYHHPERIVALAKERGPNFDKVVRLPLTPDKETKPRPKGKAATKLWAGFVLSGLGR
jgi:CHAT domain-containing protein/Tfp pilus assembly protein PilF